MNYYFPTGEDLIPHLWALLRLTLLHGTCAQDEQGIMNNEQRVAQTKR